MEGEVLGGGGDEVSVMPVIYPRGTVHVLSISSFLYVVSSSNTSHPPLPLSLSEYTAFKIISRIIGRGGKNTSSHRRRRPGARIR